MLVKILFFGVMLLIGADKLSIESGGNNYRFVQLLTPLLLLPILIESKKIILPHFPSFLFILFSFVISMSGTTDISRSVSYLIWMISNYIFFIVAFSNLINKNNVISILRTYFIVFHVIGVTTILVFILGLSGFDVSAFGTNFLGYYRISLFFYEPSYLATYLILFYGINFYLFVKHGNVLSVGNLTLNNRRNLVLSLLYLLSTTSTTGFMGIIISCPMSLFIIRRNSRSVIFIIFAVILTLLIIVNIPHDINRLFLRVFTDGIEGASGGRLSEYETQINVFLKHPLFGIGVGTYPAALTSNVILEILVNTGILGCVALSLFFISVYKKIIIVAKKIYEVNYEYSSLLFAFMFSFLLFLIVLQANQNYMRLYLWQHIGIMIGMAGCYKLTWQRDLMKCQKH